MHGQRLLLRTKIKCSEIWWVHPLTSVPDLTKCINIHLYVCVLIFPFAWLLTTLSRHIWLIAGNRNIPAHTLRIKADRKVLFFIDFGQEKVCCWMLITMLSLSYPHWQKHKVIMLQQKQHVVKPGPQASSVCKVLSVTELELQMTLRMRLKQGCQGKCYLSATLFV